MSHDRSVLIVDDDEGLVQIMALILRQVDFGVRTAVNGAHGHADYSLNPTEWVITDIQMPELDGLQMMQCIRSINPRVKAVYMSGELDKYLAELQHEVSEFDARLLPKPFTKNDLIGRLSAEHCRMTESEPGGFGLGPETKEDIKWRVKS